MKQLPGLLIIIFIVNLGLNPFRVLHAQEHIELLHADSLVQFIRNGQPVKKLDGNVNIVRGELRLECDLAYWWEKQNRIEFYGNVLLRHQEQLLRCDSLFYHTRLDLLTATGRPEYQDGEIRMDARWLEYDRKNKVVHTRGFVNVRSRERDIQAEEIFYNEETEKVIALNSALLTDKQRHISLKADSLIFDNTIQYIEAWQNPVFTRLDSLNRVVFIVKAEQISGEEKTGIFTASRKVVISKERLQAYCETLSYNDSLQTASLKGAPKVENQDQLLSGIEMLLRLDGNQLHSLIIDGKAQANAKSTAYLPATQPGSARSKVSVEDRISGQRMEVYFRSGKTDSLCVAAMARSYYHVLDDSLLQGLNETSGDSIFMKFKSGKLATIDIVGGTQGVFTPDASNSDVDTTIIYSADKIHYNLKTAETDLRGRASIRSGDISLKSGLVSVKWNENLLYAVPLGTAPFDSIPDNLPVLEQRGQEPFTGEELVYNLKTQRGRIAQGKTKVEDGFFYGDKVDKITRDVFYVSEGIYTTCDLPENPHYYFRSKQMKLIHKDKVIAKPIILYIHDIPIIGLPFALFPTKGGRRHSGWIMPSYGENRNVGGFIKGLGYFWAPNDYLDHRLTADFFDKKGIILHYQTRYALRYHFRGSINSSYTNELFSDFPTKRWSLNINHSQTISPTMQFSADGRFVSDASYYQNIGIDRDTRLNQQLISNATLRKSWPGTPYSMSANLNQTQNLQAQKQIETAPSSANQKIHYITRSMPNISFNHSQIPVIPPQKGRSSSQTKWYNNIFFSLNSQFKNDQEIYYISVDDADSLAWEKHSPIKNAFTHSISLTGAQKILKYVSINENVSVNEGWVFQYSTPLRDSTGAFIISNNTIQTHEVAGFQARHTGNASINAQTKLYGMFPIRIGALQSLRHVATPQIGLRFSPDFSRELFGWNPGYVESWQDSSGKTWNYDIFNGTLLGATPSYEQKSMTFSLRNILQAKILRDGEEKKFDLFTLNFSSSYNFAADSLRLAPLSTSFRTQLTRQLAIVLSASHDFYAYEQRKINRWHKTVLGIPIPRLTSLNLSTGFSLSGKRFGLTGTAPITENTENDTLETTGIESDVNTGSRQSLPSSGSQLWSANFDFRYSISKQIPTQKDETLWMRLNLKVNLTKNWSIGYRANFDLLNKKIISQDFSVERDLHCWQLSFSWTPSGYNKQYFLTIHVKSPTLRDLKYEERGGRRQSFGY